ncbi:DUF3363 domain-containing protein [Brevundimonas lutea]|uniref:DUF3363 domain-containing protein n=1 Tax=Brevundimonas lutea TaxID=2293980 RepID=UPI000F02D16A|nr:DUF3363 domain-containing protein [Brevundimonas lutea]
MGEFDEDRAEIRVTLMASRERAAVWLKGLTFAGRATAAMTPRQRARHFSGKGGPARLRNAPSGAVGGQRRVMVKARVVRMTPQAARAMRTHVRYVARDGAGEDGAEGRFFDRGSDQADARAFVGRCEGDRHHFRLIVNPEDGAELPDLKSYAREFVGRVERDLGTSVDWVAGAHYDTGRPHLHILMRGKRDDGRDLVMSRDYVSHGLRNRAQELATELLGPRLERDVDRGVTANRVTGLDRTLVEATRDGQLGLADLPEGSREQLLRRLVHLETEGLVTRERAGRWSVPDDLRRRLQVLGEREGRETAAVEAVRSSGGLSDFGRLEAMELKPGQGVVGLFQGAAPIGTYAEGPQVLVLQLEDGRLGHLRMPGLRSVVELDRTPARAVVEVKARPVAPRPSDLTIAEVAAERGGVWSPEDHRAVRPRDSSAFIERHQRRLEAMGREGACRSLNGGKFEVPTDYVGKATAAERDRHGGASLEMTVLDGRSVEQQVTARAETWLDDQLGKDPATLGSGPFGELVRDALPRRAAALRAMGIPAELGRPLTREQGHQLLRMEIEDLSRFAVNGRSVRLAVEGQRFTGTYLQKIQFGRVSFAVIENPAVVTLAPWRAALEACRGQAMNGVMLGGQVDFRFGRQASGRDGLEL